MLELFTVCNQWLVLSKNAQTFIVSQLHEDIHQNTVQWISLNDFRNGKKKKKE